MAMSMDMFGGHSTAGQTSVVSPLHVVSHRPTGIWWIHLLLLTHIAFPCEQPLARGRQIWTAHPENEYDICSGFWEKEVCGTWEAVKQSSRMWWETSWRIQFRMDRATFVFVLQRYEHLLVKQETNMRRTIPPAKRLAVLLYYIGHGETYAEIAALFHLGQSTVAEIVHEGVASLAKAVSRDSILFPVGKQLTRTMRRFEELSGLPYCGGAIDGTFTKITKPDRFGDLFWCYKQFSAVLLFVCVDSRGLFTFVDVGAPGSVGDAAVFNNSALKAKLLSGEWLNYRTWTCGNADIRPYVVGDSAFGLSSCVVKIYSDPNLAPAQANFNYAQIRTRCVVECAIGKLKERFRVVAESNSKDPKFVSKVNMLCCAMQNIIERKETAYLPHYPNYAPQPLVAMNPSAASVCRDALAQFVHGLQ
eukprot:scpid72153/ scgid23837/ Putative nuclease HARBI1; Harbinger transposase-derived nuclease